MPNVYVSRGIGPVKVESRVPFVGFEQEDAMTDQPPPKQHVVVHAAWWRYVFWTLLIGGILAFITCSVIGR